MKTNDTERVGARVTLEVAKAFATATVSLALGVAICLCLFFGGLALASGTIDVEAHHNTHPTMVATPAEHAVETTTVALEKITERATERRAFAAHESEGRPVEAAIPSGGGNRSGGDR
jgi:hypothetical protein